MFHFTTLLVLCATIASAFLASELERVVRFMPDLLYHRQKSNRYGLVRRLCNLDAVGVRTISAPAGSRTGFWKDVVGDIFAVLYPRLRG